MNSFQILTLIISGVTLLAAIFGVYTKLKVDITKIEVELKGMQKEIQAKEIALLNLEKVNRDDHNKIIDRLNTLIERKNV